MADATKLLPCPFCGSADVAVDDVLNAALQAIGSHVVCAGCGVEGPGCGTPESAAERWNTRPTYTRLTQRLAVTTSWLKADAEDIDHVEALTSRLGAIRAHCAYIANDAAPASDGGFGEGAITTAEAILGLLENSDA